MKKFVSLVLLAAALAVSARAEVVVGAQVGYLLDSETALYSARLGYQFKTPSTLLHQVEIEYGYTKDEDSGLEMSIAPLTANYRLSTTPNRNLSYYFGVGAGVSQINIDYYYWYHSDHQPLTVQTFAGASYHFTPNASFNLDVKYLWIDDVTVLGSSVEVGDDVAISAGLTIKF